jgi:heme/copper-type cytochrome/quinol oxidase subunit 1
MASVPIKIKLMLFCSFSWFYQLDVGYCLYIFGISVPVMIGFGNISVPVMMGFGNISVPVMMGLWYLRVLAGDARAVAATGLPQCRREGR